MSRGGFVLLVFVLTSGAGAALAHAAREGRSGTSTVTVVMTDARLRLSQSSVLVGEVSFAVSNAGKDRHRFSVAGKATPLLAAGQRATLKIAFARAGRYRYFASGLAVASRGAGSLDVVARPPVLPLPLPLPLPAPPAPTTTVATVVPCTNPVATTVTVTMSDTTGPTGYTFSPLIVPCGTATFVLNNVGSNQHGLSLKSPSGIESPASPTIDPHQSGGVTVSLAAKGQYQWWDAAGEGFETTYGTLVVQ